MTGTLKAKKTNARLVLKVLILLWLIPAYYLSAQTVPKPPTGVDVIETYKNNVIRLAVQFTSSQNNETTESNGFGFVVGEQDHYLYVVTAKHVVWKDEPGFSVNITAYFYSRQAEGVNATMLDLSYENLDLALLKIRKPSSFYWKRCSYSPPKRNKRIWFIGRNGDWWIPATFQTGEIVQTIVPPKLKVNINSVDVGSSGAPLISERGIFGMITDTSSGMAYGLDIETIKRCVQDIWRYPWNLESRAGKICQKELCSQYIKYFLWIADFGNFSEIRRLIEEVGVDVNCQNPHGMTALYAIAGTERVDEQTQIQIVQYLLRKGADRNLAISDDFYGPQYNGWKPITYARSTLAGKNGRSQHQKVINLLTN